MQDDQNRKDNKQPEVRAGYLVMRLKTGEGVMVSDLVEIRINLIKTLGEAQIAIKAPKDLVIRKVK